MTTAVVDPTPAAPAAAVDPLPAVPSPADPAPPAAVVPAPAPVAPPVDPAPPADPAPSVYELLFADDAGFVAHEVAHPELAAARVATATRFLKEAEADPDLGGQKWPDTVTHAKAGIVWALQTSSPEEQAFLQSTLDRTGLGNHKAWIRLMARIGRARAEDRPAGQGTTSPPVERKATTDVLFPSTAAKA